MRHLDLKQEHKGLAPIQNGERQLCNAAGQDASPLHKPVSSEAVPTRGICSALHVGASFEAASALSFQLLVDAGLEQSRKQSSALSRNRNRLREKSSGMPGLRHTTRS